MEEKKFIINMSKEEMIKFYANKIVEDGIKNCTEFSNIIDINDYGNLMQYKSQILDYIFKDKRVSDASIDEKGNIDMIFYTDFCPFYYDEETLKDSYYDTDPKIKMNLLKELIYYYSENCLFNNPYITTRDLFNQFAEKKSLISEVREELVNTLKKALNQSGFIEKNIDGIEVYVTPKNYKELEQATLEIVKESEQDNEEEIE